MQPDVSHDDGARPAPPMPSRSVRLRMALGSAAICVMPRTVSDTVWAQIDTAAIGSLPNLLFVTQPMTVGTMVTAALSKAGFGPPDLSAWLSADIQDLAYLYAGATAATHVAVKLWTETADDASRFHIADVDYRLVTTYRGPGTEWVPPRALARSAPGRPLPPDAVRQLERGAVAILKGRRGATAEAPGLLHRSPRSADTPRLTLSIDGGEGTRVKDLDL